MYTFSNAPRPLARTWQLNFAPEVRPEVPIADPKGSQVAAAVNRSLGEFLRERSDLLKQWRQPHL